MQWTFNFFHGLIMIFERFLLSFEDVLSSCVFAYLNFATDPIIVELTISTCLLSFRPNLPFSDWSLDSICDWLMEKGLDSYVNAAKKWIVSGTQLLNATSHDLEKHLGIKVSYSLQKDLSLTIKTGDPVAFK